VASTTEVDEPNPWWQVEVGNNSIVNEVVLHNRTDACCTARLQDFTVFVSQTDMAGRSYADLLADPAIAKVTQPAAAGPVTTIPFITAAPLPVVEVNLTSAAGVKLSIPGYVAIPQGRLVVSTSAGSETSKDITIDPQGRLIVADRGNNRLQILDQDGRFIAEWKQFGRPSGVYIRNDVIYVADSESNSSGRNPGWLRGIRIGNLRDGKVLYRIADPLELPGTSAAEGVAVDAKGNVFGGEVGPRQLVKHFRP